MCVCVYLPILLLDLTTTNTRLCCCGRGVCWGGGGEAASGVPNPTLNLTENLSKAAETPLSPLCLLSSPQSSAEI